MFLEENNKPLFQVAAWAAMVSAAAVIIWVITMVVYRVPEGAPAEQLLFLAAMNLAAGIPYLNACLISLLQIPVFTGLYFLLRQTAPTAALLGGLAGIIYAVYSLAAYWEQLIMVVRLPELYRHLTDPALKSVVEQQYFLFASFQQHTPIYALDQLGYFMLALASLVLGTVLCRQHRGAGYALLASGLAGLAGAVGYLTAVPWLEFGCVVAGAIYLFFLALVARAFFAAGKGTGV